MWSRFLVCVGLTRISIISDISQMYWTHSHGDPHSLLYLIQFDAPFLKYSPLNLNQWCWQCDTLQSCLSKHARSLIVCRPSFNVTSLKFAQSLKMHTAITGYSWWQSNSCQRCTITITNWSIVPQIWAATKCTIFNLSYSPANAM